MRETRAAAADSALSCNNLARQFIVQPFETRDSSSGTDSHARKHKHLRVACRIFSLPLDATKTLAERARAHLAARPRAVFALRAKILTLLVAELRADCSTMVAAAAAAAADAVVFS